MNKPIENVVVVGGGSAGYLAALTLKIKAPNLSIKVIKSKDIPIIGVGESTIRSLPFFLFNYLGLNKNDFYKKVKASWKIGIKFLWGEKGSFNYSFQDVLTAKSSHLQKHNSFYYLAGLKHGCLEDILMDRNISPLKKIGNKQIELEHSNIGLHIENELFVSYLESELRQRDVEIITNNIENISSTEKQINFLKLRTGEKIEADLFIDCSGFQSMLLGKSLKAQFKNFQSSLFCDTAITGTWVREKNETILPYTTAETMNSGWCWQIDLRDKINRGYVFSSQFCSTENAIKELKLTNPRLEENSRVLKFTPGRYQNFWVGNVAAIGNASGFVEPLEATGLHMICETSRRLVEALIDSDFIPTQNIKECTNQIIGELWDDIRWFLSIHYKFNRRRSTPFWKHCWEETNSSGAQQFLDFYYNNGPSTLAFHYIHPHSIFGLEGYLAMMVGQNAPTKFVNKLDTKDIETFKSISSELNTHVKERYLEMKDAVKVL